MKKLILILFAAIFAITFVSAGATCLTVISKTTSAYLNEIPQLNSQLSTCVISVPSSATTLIGDGNLLVNINMNSGSTEQFYATISNQKVTAITRGNPTSFTYQATLSESTFDKILKSNDALNEVLRGVKNKDIIIKANSFIGSIKLFFAKFFLPNPQPAAPATPPTPTPTPTTVPGPTGKPDFCDETFLPGHRDYAANQALWDGYSANTDKVCQSQFGRGIPSPCIHSVQLSISGNPYYLCWYNE